MSQQPHLLMPGFNHKLHPSSSYVTLSPPGLRPPSLMDAANLKRNYSDCNSSQKSLYGSYRDAAHSSSDLKPCYQLPSLTKPSLTPRQSALENADVIEISSSTVDSNQTHDSPRMRAHHYESDSGTTEMLQKMNLIQQNPNTASKVNLMPTRSTETSAHLNLQESARVLHQNLARLNYLWKELTKPEKYKQACSELENWCSDRRAYGMEFASKLDWVLQVFLYFNNH